jgi:hypothetical protein
VILCATNPDKVDDRTRSKWSRVLRHAAEYKDLDEALTDFIVHRRGINKCGMQFARRPERSQSNALVENANFYSIALVVT